MIKNKVSGRLIIFEGIDHVGKSTLISLVKKAYIDNGREVIDFQFPGKEKGTLGKLIYDIHHGKVKIENISPLSLQTLHVAAHVNLLEQKILPLLESGYDILLDRYWWSTIAYGIANGIARGKLEKIVSLEKEITDLIENKVIFYITREIRESDYEKIMEKKILNEYEMLFNNNCDVKYKIRNDDTIHKTVENILNKLEIN